MQAVDGTPTPAQILAAYTQAVGACPLITGRVIPPASDKTITILNQALLAARQEQNWLLAAQYASTLGLIYFERYNLHESRMRTEEAVTMLRTVENKEQLANVLGNLALIEYYQGDAEQALVHVREATQLAIEINQPTLQGYLFSGIGAILCYLGKYQDADTAFDQAFRAFARTEDEMGMAWWQFTQAREKTRDKGDCSEVIKQVIEAQAVLQEKSGAGVIIEIMLTLADAYLCLGQLEKASEVLQKVDTLITQGKRYWYRPEAFLVKAQLALAENDVKQATKFAYSGLGLAGDQGDLRVLGALYHLLGQLLERDRTRLEDAQDSVDRAIAIGRVRSRRLHLALAVRQAGLYLKHHANRPTGRARSSGFLFEAERMFTEMGIPVPQPTPQKKSSKPSTPPAASPSPASPASSAPSAPETPPTPSKPTTSGSGSD
jgi:tetratricopeptide (TPR) repeat protein